MDNFEVEFSAQEIKSFTSSAVWQAILTWQQDRLELIRNDLEACTADKLIELQQEARFLRTLAIIPNLFLKET